MMLIQVTDCLSRLDSEIDGQIDDETEHFERHIYQFDRDNFHESLKKAQLDYPATKVAMEQLIETGTVSYGPFLRSTSACPSRTAYSAWGGR